jgi:DNA-binding SARP family transcriptional activator
MVDHPQGRSEGALEILEGVVSCLDREERADALALLPEVRAQRALVLSHLGHHEEALAESARLAAVAGRRGLGPLVANVVDEVRLEALASLARWPELAAAVEPVVDPLDGAALPARRRLALARLCVSRGEALQAGRHLRAGADAARRAGGPFERALLLADLGLVAIEASDERLAYALATEARDLARAIAAPWARCRAAMVMAASADDDATARAAVDEALELSARWSLLMLWTRREPDLAAQLLPWAVAEGLGPDGVAARLARTCGGRVAARCVEELRDTAGEPSWRFPIGLGGAGPRMLEEVDLLGRAAAAPGSDGEQPAGARIRILTLGRFSVLRDGAPPTRVDFHRMKARAVLALLLADPGPVSRERLIGVFWPHLSAQRATAALNSTMHTLRHALDPALTRGARSSCVRFAGNAYSLSLGWDDEWDAREFLALARRGLDAEGDGTINLLRVADAAYTGPFLPEWPDADWAARRREEIEVAHRRVLEALGARLLRTRRVREGVDVLRRLVLLAPDHEAAHRALMTAHLQAGERGLALRQYDDCVARLSALGVRPSPETQAIHDNLLSPPPLAGWAT